MLHVRYLELYMALYTHKNNGESSRSFYIGDRKVKDTAANGLLNAMGFGLRKLKKHCVTLLLLGVVLVVLSMHWMSQQATSKSLMSPKYALMQSPRFASSNSDDVGNDVDTKIDDDNPIPAVQLDPQVNPFQFRDPSERLDHRQKSLDADKERRNIFDKSQRKGDDERRQRTKDDEQSEVDKNEQNLLQKIGERDRQMAIDPKKQKQADLDARQKQNENRKMGDSDEDRQMDDDDDDDDEEKLRQKDAARQGGLDEDRQDEDRQDEDRQDEDRQDENRQQLDPEDKRKEQDVKKNSLLDAERQKQAMQRRAEGNKMRKGGGGGERNPDDPPSGGENGDPPGEKGGKLDFEPPANAPVDTEFLKKMAENHNKHKGNPLQNVLVHPRDAKSFEELKLGQDLVAPPRDNQRMQQQQQQHPKLQMFVDTGNQQNDAWNKRRLHRSFSLNGLVGGNMYSSKGKVVHVAIFVERPSMTFAMALTLSITKHTTSNVTFHFVTLTDDRQFFKEELDKTILERQGFEIVEFPNDWLKGFSLMEVGHYYIPDLMPYMSGCLLVLDPYCLVTGDIKTLFTTNIGLDTWAGMPSLCKPEMSGVHLPEKYKDYLNFSHPEIDKLKLKPDACAMSPAVKLQDLPKTRLALTKNKLWKWTELNQKEPLFLKRGEGRDSRIGPTIVTFQGHSKTLDEQWYCPVDDKSSLGKCSLYHWVGEGKPGTGDSQMATLWNTYLVPATALRPRE